jgi:hypothetical protein
MKCVWVLSAPGWLSTSSGVNGKPSMISKFIQSKTSQDEVTYSSFRTWRMGSHHSPPSIRILTYSLALWPSEENLGLLR